MNTQHRESKGRRGAVHQFVPALIPRDATGCHTLLLRDALRSAGWRSDIFAEATHDELLGETRPIDEYPGLATPHDVLIYQFSTSSMVAEFLAGRAEQLVLDYHNLTAPALLEQWDLPSARRSAEAADQLAVLAPRAVLGIADSRVNEMDLQALGCPHTVVVPVLVDFDRFDHEPDRRVMNRLASLKSPGGIDWLFVGRVVPSKAQHDLVKAFWVYRELYDPLARLHLVGQTPAGNYLSCLRTYIDDLGLESAVRITGEVSDAALASYYRAADVYVSLSVHEGFGVPLMEALRAEIPVVARVAGAIPDTLGIAGILLEDAAPLRCAAAVHRVATDDALRARLAEAGRTRVAAHTLSAVTARAIEAIASVAGSPPGRTVRTESVGR